MATQSQGDFVKVSELIEKDFFNSSVVVVVMQSTREWNHLASMLDSKEV